MTTTATVVRFAALAASMANGVISSDESVAGEAACMIALLMVAMAVDARANNGQEEDLRDIERGCEKKSVKADNIPTYYVQ